MNLKPGSKPVKAKVRPTNPKQRADLREQLDRWVAEDVVEECESPWASALVPVLKKDGSTRWAVDYRPLNKMTIKDSYPLPSISENLDKLQGSKVFLHWTLQVPTIVSQWRPSQDHCWHS